MDANTTALRETNVATVASQVFSTIWMQPTSSLISCLTDHTFKLPNFSCLCTFAKDAFLPFPKPSKSYSFYRTLLHCYIGVATVLCSTALGTCLFHEFFGVYFVFVLFCFLAWLPCSRLRPIGLICLKWANHSLVILLGTQMMNEFKKRNAK